tara:strand:- start:1676 stop:2326 length:651 start_codon:yes stop_codon:yes gene_type:complete
MYTNYDLSYRKLPEISNTSTHSKNTTEETQWRILNCLIDDLQDTTEDDYVVFDRNPLDNIVYSMWKNAKNTDDISDKFVGKSIQLVKEAIKFLDVIFFLPITAAAPVTIVDDGTRETDPIYREEIDTLFKCIRHQWEVNPGFKLCDPEDRPPIIEVFGSEHERIEMLKLYLNVDGDVIGDDAPSILDMNQIKEIETLKEGLGVAGDEQSKAFQDTF